MPDFGLPEMVSVGNSVSSWAGIASAVGIGAMFGKVENEIK